MGLALLICFGYVIVTGILSTMLFIGLHRDTIRYDRTYLWDRFPDELLEQAYPLDLN